MESGTGTNPPDSHGARYQRAFEDWKRVRTAIEFENTLINYRQTWHAGLQLPLVAAFFVVFSEIPKSAGPVTTPANVALILLPLLGVAVAAFIQTSILAASKQTKILEDWWFTTHSQGNRVDYLAEHPPINGIFAEKLYKGLDPAFVPTLFMTAWVIALGASVYQIARTAVTLVKEHGFVILILYSVVVSFVSLYSWLRRNKPASAVNP